MLSRWIMPPVVAFAAVLGVGAAPAGADTAVAYTCKSPLGTDAPAQVQIRASLPVAAAVGQNLNLEWAVDTGLLAQDALPAGAVVQKGTLRITTSNATATPSAAVTPPSTGSTPTASPTSSATATADAATTVATTSPPNSIAINKGQPLNGGAMKGTYTPRQAGMLSVVPGDVTLVITRDGVTQETVCTADAAAPALGAITVKGLNQQRCSVFPGDLSMSRTITVCTPPR